MRKEWWTDVKMYWQGKDEEIKGSRERFRCTSGMSSTMNVIGAAAVPQSISTIALSWCRNRSCHLHASLALPIQSCHDEHENGALSGSITWGMFENRAELSRSWVLHRNCGWYGKSAVPLVWLLTQEGVDQMYKSEFKGSGLAARLKRGPKKSCCQAAHSSNAERVASPGGPAGLSSSPVLGNTLAWAHFSKRRC